MMENNGLVSVLVPMYNTEKWLSKCLNSIINQTYKNLEIILVDDGSVDNTYNIAKSYADKDTRIKLLTKQNERSISKTRNFLLKNITGEYFVWVDSDDSVDPRYVERLKSVMDEENADMVSCEFCLEIVGHRPIKHFKKKKKIFTGEDIVPHMILNKDIHFVLWNKIFKTSLLKEIKFDESIRNGEDLIFCVDYARKCKKVVTIKDKLYRYLFRSGSESHQKYSEKDKSLIDALERYIATEKDENVLNVYKAWIAFSSCVGIFTANKKEWKGEIERLKGIVKTYIPYFYNNKHTRKLYKLAARLIVLFKGIK